jgi:hypothetical protein
MYPKLRMRTQTMVLLALFSIYYLFFVDRGTVAGFLNKGQERYQFVHTQDQYPLSSPEL